MECYSQRFRSIIQNLLSSDKILIATIAEKGTGFIEKIKKTEDIAIFEITEHNREKLVFEIEERIKSWF